MVLAEKITEYMAGIGSALKELFFSAGSFLSPLPLIVALLISAFVLSRRAGVAGEQMTLKKLGSRLFPRDIWRHRSARHDFFIILINDGFLFFLPGAAAALSVFLLHQAASGTGIDFSQPAETNIWIMLAFGIYAALAWDFFASYGHYLKHKVPLLWEFHKVHHCAEVLTPLTAMRRHPVEAVFSAAFVTAGLSAAAIVWIAIFGAPGGSLEIGGVTLFIYLWRLLGYNIRHSHVWISYGPFWNRVFISPAHHQLHHSRDPKHYDCNFGHIFTCWDRIFGTLYEPVEAENFEFGIEHEENAELQTLGALYIRPMQKAAERFVPGRQSSLTTVEN